MLTFNLRDFPRRALAGFCIEAIHPDGFLWECLSHRPDLMAQVVDEVLAAVSSEQTNGRNVLKRARLSRLGKAWEALRAGS